MRRRVKSCCDIFVIFVFSTCVFLCKKIDKSWERNSNVIIIFNKWSTNTVISDGENGERDWGELARHTFHYQYLTFRTNTIS